MRLPRNSANRGSSYEIAMTPMIDVVFLLLVFFVWTASFQLAEYRLPGAVSLPKDSTAASAAAPQDTPPPEADFEQVVVRVLWNDGQPVWRLNDQVVPHLAAVRAALTRIAQIKADVPVVLHPDSPVPVGHVIDTYDAARMAGFARVRFAASAHQKEPR